MDNRFSQLSREYWLSHGMFLASGSIGAVIGVGLVLWLIPRDVSWLVIVPICLVVGFVGQIFGMAFGHQVRTALGIRAFTTIGRELQEQERALQVESRDAFNAKSVDQKLIELSAIAGANEKAFDALRVELRILWIVVVALVVVVAIFQVIT